jgi:hypothetical protein
MSRLVYIAQDGQQHSLELGNSGTSSVGRGPDNDFSLDHPTLSGRHCEITLQGEQIRVRDLGSTNGTFIEGNPVGPEGSVLAPGQTLQLGDLKLMWETTRIEVPEGAAWTSLEQEPTVLADGTPACQKHPDEVAVWACTNCHHSFCNPCVHHLRRMGGKYLNLCPECGFPCHLLKSAAPTHKQGLIKRLGRWLGNTVRIGH